MSVVLHQAEQLSPQISLSDSALKHLLTYLDKNPGQQGVRLSVKKTGCSGLAYVVDYVHAAHEGDLLMPLAGDYQLCVDKSSYPFLKGMHIDYVKEGLNQKFVFSNPNQTGQCGCGESFTVE